MRVGHLLWALLAGYMGGRFALFVRTQRVAMEDPSVAPCPGSLQKCEGQQFVVRIVRPSAYHAQIREGDSAVM